MSRFSQQACYQAAFNKKLRVKCKRCHNIIDIDVSITPNLPECKHCGPTDWHYALLAVDILKLNGALAS